MNIKKSLAALTLVSAFSTFADPIQLDVGQNYDGIIGGDADSLTGFFDQFTFGTFNPTSAYVDFDSDGGIEQGNLVFDSAFGVEVASLNYTAENELYNFPVSYTLYADYEFYGFAGFDDVNNNNTQEAGESIGAQFVGGYLNLFMTDNSTSTTVPVLGTSVIGSSFDLGNQGINFSIDMEVIGAADDFLYFQQPTDGLYDIFDILAVVEPGTVEAKITTEITNAGATPTYDDGYVATAYQTAILDAVFNVDATEVDFLTRTTTLDSANLSVSVVSEPASLAVFGLGLLGLAGAARRRKA